MSLILTVRTEKAVAALQHAQQTLQTQRRAALLKAALIVEREAKKRAPHDTGRLRSSITHEVRSDREAAVGTNVVYAAMQELGGTITPKTAKALTVPVAKEAKRRRAGDFKNLFIPRGRAILAQRAGKGKLKVMFALKQSVTIKGKRYLQGALEAKRDAVKAVFDALVKEAVNG